MSNTVKTYIDFSSGLYTDCPRSFVPDSGLEVSKNCYWDNGLVMRKGYAIKYTFAGQVILGYARSDFSGTMLDYIVTKNTTSKVVTLNVRGGENTKTLTLSVISGEEESVRMVDFAGYLIIVGCDGHSKISVIAYNDGTYSETTIDALDTRTRGPENWYAGHSDGTTFVDDSVAAQDGSWALAESGKPSFYIASPYVFNRIKITGLTAGISSAVVKISAGKSWITVVPRVLAIGADFVMEFDLPFSGSEITFLPSELDDPLASMYTVMVTPTFSAGIASGVISEVQDTQYFSQMTGNENPTDVEVYKSMLCVASGNVVNFSLADSITDWEGDYVEVFLEGGNGIKRLVKNDNSLLVLKERALYGFSGSPPDNVTITRYADYGTDNPDSAVSIGTGMMFVSMGRLIFFDGTTAVVVSSHVRSVISANLSTACAARDADGHYFVVGNGVGFMVNPTTIGQDSIGNYKMAVYEFTNQPFSGMVRRVDDDVIMGWYSDTLYTLFCGTIDVDKPISMEFKTKSFDFGYPANIKHYARMKTIGIAHGDDNGTFSVEFEADTSRTFSYMLYVSGIIAFPYINIPFDMDGYLLSVDFSTSSSAGASILGLALDMSGGLF